MFGRLRTALLWITIPVLALVIGVTDGPTAQGRAELLHHAMETRTTLDAIMRPGPPGYTGRGEISAFPNESWCLATRSDQVAKRQGKPIYPNVLIARCKVSTGFFLNWVVIRYQGIASIALLANPELCLFTSPYHVSTAILRPCSDINVDGFPLRVAEQSDGSWHISYQGLLSYTKPPGEGKIVSWASPSKPGRKTQYSQEWFFQFTWEKVQAPTQIRIAALVSHAVTGYLFGPGHIVFSGTNQCLEAHERKVGAEIEAFTCDGNPLQLWNAIAIPFGSLFPGYVHIELVGPPGTKKHPALCIGGIAGNGESIKLIDCTDHVPVTQGTHITGPLDQLYGVNRVSSNIGQYIALPSDRARLGRNPLWVKGRFLPRYVNRGVTFGYPLFAEDGWKPESEL